MSDDKAEELKKNILSPSQWMRILYMAFYAVACWLLTIVLSVIIVAQVLISLITGEDNENLRTVGKKVSDYFHELLSFLVYATNVKPWPFSESGLHTENDSDDDEDDFDDLSEDAEEPADDTVTEPESPAPKTVTSESDDDVFADISFTETKNAPDDTKRDQESGPGEASGDTPDEDKKDNT